MSYILPPLRSADRERYHTAVHALHEGSLTITITRHTDNEIRALVQNGDGRQYGVTVNSSPATCSCYDALFRGVTLWQREGLAKMPEGHHGGTVQIFYRFPFLPQPKTLASITFNNLR